jgi:hypothetical protein
MEIFITLLIGFVSALIVAYITFRYFRKKIKRYTGSMQTHANVTRLFNWLTDRSDEIFLLDINLSQEFADEFKKSNRFSSPEYNEEYIKIGGVIIEFKKDDLDELFIDMRPSSNRIKGYFKINHASGPQQGWFLIILKSVKIENVYNNL